MQRTNTLKMDDKHIKAMLPHSTDHTPSATNPSFSHDTQIPHIVRREPFPAEPPIESSPTPQITPDEDVDREAQSQTAGKKRLKPHHLFREKGLPRKLFNL